MRTFLATLLVVSFICAIQAAPAPVPKKRLVPGLYVMKWGGTAYRVMLGKDGRYTAASSDGHYRWEGVWKWDERTSTITVSEGSVSRISYNPPVWVWSAVLSGRSGITNSGADISFTPLLHWPVSAL